MKKVTLFLKMFAIRYLLIGGISAIVLSLIPIMNDGSSALEAVGYGMMAIICVLPILVYTIGDYVKLNDAKRN